MTFQWKKRKWEGYRDTIDAAIPNYDVVDLPTGWSATVSKSISACAAPCGPYTHGTSFQRAQVTFYAQEQAGFCPGSWTAQASFRSRKAAKEWCENVLRSAGVKGSVMP